MSKMIVFFGICFVLILNLCVSNASASVPPIDESGNINGAAYRIVVPANWNKTLLIYAHGYRDKADHPGEIDNRAAEIAPSEALATVLLGQGYALAGTAYRENGWAVEEGITDLKNLTMHFKRTVAKPRANIIWAFSMGTVITFKSMEKFDDLYDGALCACGVGAGATQSWDSAGDLALAYKTVFGMPATWGTAGDVRDDIDFETEVQPKLFGEVNSPANFPKFEFLRLVTGTPGRGLNPPAPPAFYPGWIFTDMFFATEARSELERRAGGAITQNLDRDYNLTVGEKAYLMALGVPSAAIDGWLTAMNAQRTISAPNSSRRYLRKNANYSGEIENPILTIHTQFDPLVTVSQEFEYAQTVMRAGNSRRLFQTYTNGNGHCNFTGPQLITAVNAINGWVRNRTKPTAATFPAAIGFLPDFVPPPMNQP
jgi:hypothetical protein